MWPEPINFASVYSRLLFEFKVGTEEQLSEKLGLSKGAISSAKKRKNGALPAGWYLTLLLRYKLNPFWVNYGNSYPKYLTETDEVPNALPGPGGEADLVR